MPLLISLLTWLLGDSTRSIVWNGAIYAAFAAFSLASFAALFLVLKQSVSLLYVATPQVILDFWAWVAPPNFSQCLTALITAYVLIFIYQYKRDMSETLARISAK